MKREEKLEIALLGSLRSGMHEESFDLFVKEFWSKNVKASDVQVRAKFERLYKAVMLDLAGLEQLPKCKSIVETERAVLVRERE